MYLHCKIILPPAEEGGAEIEVEGYEFESGDVVTGYFDMAGDPVVVPPGASIEYIDRTPVEDPWA